MGWLRRPQSLGAGCFPPGKDLYASAVDSWPLVIRSQHERLNISLSTVASIWSKLDWASLQNLVAVRPVPRTEIFVSGREETSDSPRVEPVRRSGDEDRIIAIVY
jgi:hypothetical protein